ncbi:MAG TPA: OB-fold nucleic acid binding domain-containing protein, partial [Pirellulales bacterium]
MLRSHTCGELRADAVGQTVTLCGWVDTYRDHGGTLFVDLRDRYGLTQVVFEPSAGQELMDVAGQLRAEWVISVTGTVAHRPAGTVKIERKDGTRVETGEIEVRVSKLEVLNKCPTPP